MAALSALPQFTEVLVDAPALTALSTNINALCQQVTGKLPSTGVSSKPVCKVWQTATRSVANATVAVIPWDAELVDTDNMWTPGNSSIITIQTAGWYDVHLQTVWANGSLGQRTAIIFVNGTANPANVAAEKDELMGQTGSVKVQAHLYDHFAAGTVLRGAYYQDTGGSLSTLTTSGSVWMSVAYDAPY
ncbi:hypothetical protein [Pseudonocardia sp. T1-2H]|uniref:hypothetical protein n=1 Tax=Pseudonocardia sp. T1-2H TaxID=3128899 RepID=UPI00310100A1